jgi:hypothetical protein
MAVRKSYAKSFELSPRVERVFLEALRFAIFKSLQHSSCGYLRTWRNVMHAVIREYSGSGVDKLFDLLEKKKAEVEKVIKPVKGFVSYSLVRTARGGFSVTVCQDKAGADESVRVAREWIAKNASDAGAAAPTVSEGAVILHF